METVKVLIVEDELIIAEALKHMLENMGYEVPAIFISGRATLENFKPGFADIIIMDIHLADGTNGVDTSIELRKVSTVPIIYITDNKDAHLQKKAIYETNAVQYITKPFTSLDVAGAIHLAIKAIKTQELTLNTTNDKSHLIDEYIFVKEAIGYKKVMVSDILFLKADGSYCNLLFKGNKKNEVTDILFSENLSFLETKLAFAKNLIRVHRSYIININAVRKIQDNRLWIEENEIPIGKTYKEEVRQRFRFV